MELVQNNKIKSQEKQKCSKETNRHQIGHRKRTREKFLNAPSESITDQELLEILLYFSHPRIDVKPLAKDILSDFKSFRNFIMKAQESGDKMQKYSDKLPFIAKLIRESILKILLVEAKTEPIVDNWQDMVNYLRIRFCGATQEKFSVMYLDNACRILDIVEFGIGTVNESTVYIREIIKVALEKGSTQIALCHNHVSDNVQPSHADIDITGKIMHACKLVNIRIHDHIIVSPNCYFSFQAGGLLH